MTIQANYSILHKYRLILQSFGGEIKLEPLIKFRQQIMSDPEYNPEYARLNDFRSASFVTNPAKIAQYSQFEQSASLITPSKIVLLTSNPDQVVTSMIYEMYMKSKAIVDVVSTLDKAFYCLNINHEWEEEMHFILEELRNNLVSV